MHRIIIAIALLVTARAAAADSSGHRAPADAPGLTTVAIDHLSRVSLVDRTWARPAYQPAGSTAAPPVMATHVADLGNDFLAQHLGVLTRDLVGLQLDPQNRGLKVRVGGGDTHYGYLRVAANIAMADGSARIATRIRLGVADQSVTVRLPAVEVSRVSYRDERGVEVRLPFVHAKF